jgi:TetR/AcrR family transcriptional repressor of nem operon
MESLGLTVGGFYAHFDSKQALVTEACNDSFAGTTAGFLKLVQSTPKGERLSAVINAYLSRRHRDAPEQGCFAAANSAELARHPIETRAAFARQLSAWVAVIEGALNDDGLAGDARGIASSMVGAMTLARAIDDPVLSDTFLESGKRTIRASLAEVKPKRKMVTAGHAKTA